MNFRKVQEKLFTRWGALLLSILLYSNAFAIDFNEMLKMDYPIARGQHVVRASQFQYFGFRVPPAGSKVTGQFMVAQHDIEVTIMDANGFMIWSRGNATLTHYFSGRVNAGSIDVNLSPGDYYLVVNNKYSVFTPKTFVIDVKQTF